MFTGFFVCPILVIGPQEWPNDSEGIVRQLLRVADNCVGLQEMRMQKRHNASLLVVVSFFVSAIP